MTGTAPPPPSGHVDALTGLRGVAAFSVVLAHFTIRWTEQFNGESIYPYGDIVPSWLTPSLPVLAFGVNLFFLISGFVMVAFLRHSTSLFDFTVRRLSRLWPVLILCSALTTLIIMGVGIHNRFESLQGWAVTPLEFVSSILFIDPADIGRMTGNPNLDWVDGAYWTLWVDVRFYVLVAIVYRLFSDRKNFAIAWVFIQAISVAILFLQSYLEVPVHWTAGAILQPSYLYWFTLGMAACYYVQLKERDLAFMLAAAGAIALVLESVISARLYFDGAVLPQLGIYLGLVLVFSLSLFKSPITPLLTGRTVLLLGAVSFPLYIFHQRAGLTAMVFFDDLGVPTQLILPLVTALVVAIAIALHFFVERPVRQLALKITGPWVNRAEHKFAFAKFRKGRTVAQMERTDAVGSQP
ncbi:acyltransferase [Hyphomonas sp. WL0036]|uniref:acyltransferase family protein n=1 Tax=Hyphomonas sediminis TaxID=2866160 RepID=UPI001C80D0B1|nr:acyltransferase [Hyphomonas sediminis]MBY9067957.1 acyltransferase [Hyphomonas sediminis]